jgi:hypothetical protein
MRASSIAGDMLLEIDRFWSVGSLFSCLATPRLGAVCHVPRSNRVLKFPLRAACERYPAKRVFAPVLPIRGQRKGPSKRDMLRLIVVARK